MPKNDDRHRQHAHRNETGMYRIRNVPLVDTHDLIRCFDDGWFGWLTKERPHGSD